MERATMGFLKRLAAAIAAQFGSDCEVVVHDLSADMEHTVAVIENGHVTHRSVGDGPSHIVLEALNEDKGLLQDQLNYLTKTSDGRILKSSTVYIRDDNDSPIGIFAINHDITHLLLAHDQLGMVLSLNNEEKENEPERIPTNVTELLDDLIEQSVKMIGKPVALMTKDDKIRAIQFLNKTGALLITKSGDKIAKFFGISKYTLYSYLDAKK